MAKTTWPGPFVPRTDYTHLNRPAAWVNCAHCGELFPKAIALIGRRRKKDGTRLFCSPSHQSLSQHRIRGAGAIVPLIPRNCLVCHKEFLPPKNSSPQQHCSRKCGIFTQSQKAAQWQSRMMTIYLKSRGIERSDIVCEYCGAKASVSLTHKNGDWNDQRPGNLEAHCRRCQYAKKTNKPLTKQEGTRW